jgi:hypothetical protein
MQACLTTDFSRGSAMQHVSSQQHPAAGKADPSPWRLTIAGLCASLVGIGMARFAYTPLLPAIIGAHWFSASTATYLGAANLGGHLADRSGKRLQPLRLRLEPWV